MAENQLVRTEKGGGSWFHPKLAVAFARWLDVKFSIWCNMQIEKILHLLIQHNPEPATKKVLPNGLTLEQQDSIKALVKARVEASPKDKQAKAAITCWSALKAKFGYKKPETYKCIKPEDYTIALSLVARLELDGEPDKITMRKQELIAHDVQVAEEAVKRVQGELVNEPKHNSITLALPPLAKGETVKRFFVTQYDNEVKWGVIKEGYYFDKEELKNMTLNKLSLLSV